MSIKSRMQDSSNWIMNSPESLVILMLMGTSIATLFFAVFSFAMGFSKNWFLMALFGLFCFGSLTQFIKIYKMVKKTSIKDALGGITANEFVWHKDKDGNKLYGGVDDGKCIGTEQTDEVCDEQNVGSNEVGKEGNGTNNSKSERTNAWSRFMLERSGSDVDKDGVSQGRNA